MEQKLGSSEKVSSSRDLTVDEQETRLLIWLCVGAVFCICLAFVIKYAL
jgi:hypothetical protein